MSLGDVVLDTSTLRIYAAGHIGTGELISEVAAEGRRIIIPALCLATALTAIDAFGAQQIQQLAPTWNRAGSRLGYGLCAAFSPDQDDPDGVRRGADTPCGEDAPSHR
jgi:hypothetical protein